MPIPTPQEERFLQRTIEHLRHLSIDIGPRPSTGEAEQRAALYAAEVMKGAGLSSVRLEAFQSGRSTYRPFTLAIAAGLAGHLLHLKQRSRASGLLCTLLNGAGAHGFWAESNFDDNWMRRVLPSGPSQNVIGVVPAAGKRHRRVVLVGHIDTHRTPIVYSNARWLRSFSTLVGGAFVSLLAGTLLGALTPRRKASKAQSILALLAGVAAAFQAVALALTVQADTTPYAPGANDNASGASSVLALGERLVEEPLTNTEVWVVNSGCEELGAYGVAALLEAHSDKLRDAFFLDIDMVGIGAPTLLTREGLVKAYYPDSELLAMAREVDKNNPGLLGGEHSGGAYTDAGVIIKHGFRGLVIDSQIPEGHPARERMGYWHQTEDTFDKIEPQCLSRTHRFVWALLQHIDRQAGSSA